MRALTASLCAALCLAAALAPLSRAAAQEAGPLPGTLENPVVDSAMSPDEAIFQHQPPDCPREYLERLVLVDLRYWSFDGLVHAGQIVVREDLAQDIREVFAIALQARFPFDSVKPVTHPDNLALAEYGFFPDTANSSGFACRRMVGASRWSRHARGLAVDLNPRRNPYVSGNTVLPPSGTYDPAAPGTFTPDNPVVLAFARLGWTWGGDWLSSRGFADFMHFQKVD